MTLKEEEERGGAMREKEEGNRGRGRGGKRALKQLAKKWVEWDCHLCDGENSAGEGLWTKTNRLFMYVKYLIRHSNEDIIQAVGYKNLKSRGKGWNRR